MRKLFSLLLASCVILLFLQCKEDEPIDTTGDITMNFSIEYEGEDITMIEDSVLYLSDTLFYTRFYLFLSDAYLNGVNGKEPLFENGFIQFVHDKNNTFNIIQIKDIPEGTYESLVMGLGVDSIDNALQPKDYDVSSALSGSERYWPGWSSYIFSKAEGKLISDGKLLNIAYHTGADISYRVKTFNTPIKVKRGKTTELNFVIDLKEIFRKGDTYYNLAQKPRVHNKEFTEDMMQVMDNIKRSLQLQ